MIGTVEPTYVYVRCGQQSIHSDFSNLIYDEEQPQGTRADSEWGGAS